MFEGEHRVTNLADHIRIEVKKGRLDSVFTIDELVSLSDKGQDCTIGGANYAKNSVRQILANHSIGPGVRKGESIKRGMQILFVKHKRRATYSLFEDDDGDNEPFEAPVNTIGGPQEAGSGQDCCALIASRFVEYLSEKPFRTLKVRSNSLRWHPSSGSVSGWHNRILAYEWKSSDWKATDQKVSKFISDLAKLRNEYLRIGRNEFEKQSEKIYQRIKKWGNPRGTDRNGAFVAERLIELWESQPTRVDSTLTKLYAFAKPEEYVIYDSRVAAAIVFIAEDIYRYCQINDKREETVNRFFHSCFPFLGIFPGAGGTRPRGTRWAGWPASDRSMEAQLDANRLCSAIVRNLNECKEDNLPEWNLRMVEAVLFMEGY